MIEIRPATQVDLEHCRQNPLEDATKDYPHLDLNGYALTGLIDGKIAGVGGVVVLWEGVGQGWFILTKDVLNYKVEIVLLLHKVFDKAIEDCKLWRAEAAIRCDFPRAIALIEHLGFTREGCMRKYFPDKTDAFIYAKVKDG
jgi:hypothetical protein